MRIVHVNYDAGHTGGATIAAVRIHEALLGLGVTSEFVSVLDNGSIASHHVFPSDTWRCLLRRFSTVLYRGFWRALRIRKYPPNILPTGMANHINRLKPDIVHLHWIKADTISIEEISCIEAPIVWSLHDLWPCLGLDSYPQNDWFKTGYDNVLGSLWADRWTWRRKMRAFHKLRIVPVGPSAWCAQQARASEMFSGHHVAHIPYPVDTKMFVPGQLETARRKWDIPLDRYVVLFGANMGTQWHIKGFDRLVDSLPYVRPSTKEIMRIVVFGESAATRTVCGVPVQYIGPVPTAADMATLYPAADVFAFPSRQETFGQTKSEALACGVPVVAFEETACAEGIIHGITGWVAACGNLFEFAAGIDWAFAARDNVAWRSQIAGRARESVERTYAPPLIASQWVSLYEELLATCNREV